MEAYPGNHRAFCIRAYYRNGDSIVTAQRLYRAEFNIRKAPKDDTIRKWIRMFESTHSPKVVVWAAMSGKGIIGPYFFQDRRERALTVNSERYCDMLRSFLVPQLQEFEGFNVETWFQQDGATCHTSNQSLAVVNQFFPEKVISRHGVINWPPRSPDLTPLDYFLWGYLKQKVYANKPQTLLQLKHNIRTEMAAVSSEMCSRVAANFRFRLEECQQREGQHLDNIIFAT